MSAFYGTPEGEEIALSYKAEPQVHVEPCDDPELFIAATMPERDFSYANKYHGPDRRRHPRTIEKDEAFHESRRDLLEEFGEQA